MAIVPKSSTTSSSPSASSSAANQEPASSQAQKASEAKIAQIEKPISKSETEALEECKDRFGYTDNALGELIFKGRTPYESCVENAEQNFQSGAQPAAQPATPTETTGATTIRALHNPGIKP